MWIKKYIIAWFPMLLLAVANGFIREAAFKQFLNNLHAHQLSTVTLILFLTFYIRYIVRKFPFVTAGQAWLTGFIWMCLTLTFEFTFGFYRGLSASELLADYNMADGRLWIFIPISLLMLPVLFFKKQY